MEYEPSEREIQYFIRILKSTVEWDKEKNVHWCGRPILTGDDLRKMCSNRFKKDYDNMTDKNKKKLIRRIFKELRVKQDG